MYISEPNDPAAGDKETAPDLTLKTKVAFYLWLWLLLLSLGTFAAGISGHAITLAAAFWLSLETQVAIHATIPVVLTAVKVVTVPLLLLLTPFASQHPTFQGWSNWSKAKFAQLEGVFKGPWLFFKKVVLRVKS